MGLSSALFNFAYGLLHDKLTDNLYNHWQVRPVRSSLKLPILIVFSILTTLACGGLPFRQAASSTETGLRPTRTPLPTFTPTVAVEQPLSVLAVPTATPVPPPTNTPVPPPPTNTPAPEPTATATPEPPPPTKAPAPAQAQAPAPTEPPPTQPPAPSSQNGVEAKITFRDGKDTYAVGEKVFVKIVATNVEGGIKPFGILGLTPSTGSFQTSWDNSSLEAGKPFNHEDGLAFSAPGTYKLWLSICFSSKQECQGPSGNWVRFEPGLDVIVK